MQIPTTCMPPSEQEDETVGGEAMTYLPVGNTAAAVSAANTMTSVMLRGASRPARCPKGFGISGLKKFFGVRRKTSGPTLS
jgi:hypothetical protein